MCAKVNKCYKFKNKDKRKLEVNKVFMTEKGSVISLKGKTGFGDRCTFQMKGKSKRRKYQISLEPVSSQFWLKQMFENSSKREVRLEKQDGAKLWRRSYF